MFPNIRPIAHETLSQRVYSDLREFIMGGQVQPGQRLTLKSVAEALGTSQMPVREALRQLAAEGALEFLPNKSVRVPLMTRRKFEDLLAIRLALEGLAVERASQQATPDELAEAQKHHEAFWFQSQQAQPNVDQLVDANMRFHFAVYHAAQMPSLTTLIEGLWLQIGPVLNLDLRSDSRRVSDNPAKSHHADLLKALQARDAAGARKALGDDLLNAARVILDGGKLSSD